MVFDELIGKNEILNEFLWYNSNICIDGKPVFYSNFLEQVYAMLNILEKKAD